MPAPTTSQLEWKGYAIHDTSKWTELKVIDFEPKTFDDYDIDVQIECCGVCGSDLHTATAGWGKPILPLIVGHEIVGKAVRVGTKVTSIKVGDRVGVGAQVGSCMHCEPCKTDNEQYCTDGMVHTYNSRWPNGDIAHGGYSTAIRAHEQFTFPIPDGLSSEEAAPLLCAGLTVYSPLVRHGAGPGKTVGVIGMGGLGHLAVQFAKALGSEVVVFSHSDRKKADAMTFGAKEFVATKDQEVWKQWKSKLDLIICTVDVSHGIPISSMMSTLKVHGKCIMVALPDDNLPPINSLALAANGGLLAGSHIGSKKEAIEMFELAAKHNVKPQIEVLPMSECGKALQNVRDGNVHYRHVLKMDIPSNRTSSL